MFATLYGMVRCMLNQAQVPLHICRGVWAEAAKTATDMRNILGNYKINTSAHEKFLGTKFEHLNTLHTFGEMAILEDHQSRGMRGKLNNRGRPAMFLGVQPDHARDMYSFLNLGFMCSLLTGSVSMRALVNGMVTGELGSILVCHVTSATAGNLKMDVKSKHVVMVEHGSCYNSSKLVKTQTQQVEDTDLTEETRFINHGTKVLMDLV
jgi:hypothetical protein